MKNKNGFTLIELIAVVVILSVLVLIAVIKVGNVIDEAKKGAFKSTNLMMISQVRRLNALEVTPQTYTITNGVVSPPLELKGELPTTGTVEINASGKIQLVTNNDRYCAIKRFDEDEVAVYDVGNKLRNLIQEIQLTIDPNGGTYNGTLDNTTYQVATEGTQEIGIPIREGYTFNGWTEMGDGEYSNGVFTAGYDDAKLTAQWTVYPTLTVNLGGGNTSQTFELSYSPNTEISLINPTRSGYVFIGWSYSGTGAGLSENILTTGTGDTTLTAGWMAHTAMYL
jgi:type IV pilus assembly protein PilA